MLNAIPELTSSWKTHFVNSAIIDLSRGSSSVLFPYSFLYIDSNEDIFRIEQLLATESNKLKFLSQENIFEKYGVYINFLKFASLMHCIHPKWSVFIKSMSNMCNNHFIYDNLEKIIVKTSNSRYIYDNIYYINPKNI